MRSDTWNSPSASPGRNRHPLATLRTKAGYTHGEYAQLIAVTHAELGFGHMAARREKVSRWEAGRAVPERTAQLAIAHIHAVPQEEVLRLDWPDWLHLANGDTRQLELPWTRAAVPEAILDAVAGRKQFQQEYLLATGWSARSLVKNWLDAVTEEVSLAPTVPLHGTAGRTPPGSDALSGGLVEACTRLRTLHRFAAKFSAGWLAPATELELRNLADHFLASPDALHTGRDVLILAAEGLSVCGFIARVQGEHVNAQRYYVAALRCATAAADPQVAAAVVTMHAGQYLDLEMHEEAAELLAAVRELFRRHPDQMTDPSLQALLYAQTARIHAQRGDDMGRVRAMAVGRRILSTTSPSGMPILPLRSESWLSCIDGVSLLDMDQPDRAIRHFDPVLTRQGPGLNLPPVVRALYLLRAAEAQIAVGDVTAGAESEARASALLGGVQAAAAERVRGALRAARHERK
uniref:Tri4 n=1 Tax=Kitasatospora aureofaciens TaxID=1894 RepID=A0A4P8XSH6_KITAU|nr:Tri4 [Kitasatospora aureofaciens]